MSKVLKSIAIRLNNKGTIISLTALIVSLLCTNSFFLSLNNLSVRLYYVFKRIFVEICNIID